MDADVHKERVRVCLIGPSESGKSHLLFALMEGTKNGAHGFPSSIALRVEPTEERQGPARSASEKMKLILTNRARTKYHSQVSAALVQALTATTTDHIGKYEFDMSFRPNGSESRRHLNFMVADAAGGHIFPQGLSSDAPSEEKEADSADVQIRDEFIDYLIQSAGLVIVLPFHRIEDPRFYRAMDPIIEALTPDDTFGGEPPQLKRIVIALSQYERLFVQFGSDAAQIASHPDVARGVAGSRLRDVPWMVGLRELQKYYDIRVIPTSAYGFLPDFGNPNLDPDSEPNRPFIAFQDPTENGNSEHERHPFLAADPFIFAASGLENQFMIDIEEIFGEQSGERPRRPGAEAVPPDPNAIRIDDQPKPAPWAPFVIRHLARKIERGVRQFFEP